MVAINTNIFQSQISVTTVDLSACGGSPGTKKKKQKQTHLPMQEMQEMWVWSLVWEELLEKEMETCFSILAWKIPWTEEPDGLHSWGCKESDMTEHAHTFNVSMYILCILTCNELY